MDGSAAEVFNDIAAARGKIVLEPVEKQMNHGLHG